MVFAVVLALSWNALRQIRPQEFRLALASLDQSWLLIAVALTALNIGAMGLYDVIAFSNTRSRSTERWRYGAVAFAWSNFLTLGPLAGPAMRFWLYRPAVDQTSDLHDGIVSVATAFTSGLVGWTLAVLVGNRLGFNLVQLAALALILCFGAVWMARVGISLVARLFNRKLEQHATSRIALELAAIGWFTDGSYAIRPKASYAITDEVKAIVGMDLFFGDGDSFFGNLRQNRVAYVELRYGF